MIKPNPYAAALRLAIRNTLGPDPYTVVPAPEIVEAMALAVELMGAVSDNRRPDRAQNPWLHEPAMVQLHHANIHCDFAAANMASDQGVFSLDPETGLPHIGHALLRLAFAFARLRGVGAGVERSCENCGNKHELGTEKW